MIIVKIKLIVVCLIVKDIFDQHDIGFALAKMPWQSQSVLLKIYGIVVLNTTAVLLSFI